MNIEEIKKERKHVIKVIARLNTIASELAEVFFEEDADEEDQRFLVEQLFILAKQTSGIVAEAVDKTIDEKLLKEEE